MFQINKIEKYKDVSDNYWINEQGEVLSERRNFSPLKLRETKQTKRSRNRYLEVCLLLSGSRTKKRYVKVHRLVALAFLKNDDPEKNQVNHIDENGLNNDVSNLEWVTAKQNSVYSNGKKVYCYDLNGLVKVYETSAETKSDGFNPGHVSSVCRGDVPKGRKYPLYRHKQHVFSFKKLKQDEVVQRLSKPRNFKPENWRK